jgi:hypothetical protein
MDIILNDYHKKANAVAKSEHVQSIRTVKSVS